MHLLAERVVPTLAGDRDGDGPHPGSRRRGVPVHALDQRRSDRDALSASEMARGWVAVVIFAAVVTIALQADDAVGMAVVLLIPALIAVVALPVTGNAGQGPDHDYATSAVIVFGVAIAVLTGVKISAAMLAADCGAAPPGSG